MNAQYLVVRGGVCDEIDVKARKDINAGVWAYIREIMGVRGYDGWDETWILAGNPVQKTTEKSL